MQRNRALLRPVGLTLTLALAAPGAALAYKEKDAIRDCESRIRSRSSKAAATRTFWGSRTATAPTRIGARGLLA
jgi:hypothetical protein